MMPPDRGAIKRSPYEQSLGNKGPKTTSTKTKDSRRNDVRDQHTKSETTKVKETPRNRDASVTRRLPREVSQDSQPNPTKERVVPSRSVSDRMRITSRDPKKAVSNLRENVLKRQANNEAARVPSSMRTSSRDSGAGDMASQRTKPSHQSSQSTDRSKISSNHRRDSKQKSSGAGMQSVKPESKGSSISRTKTATSDQAASKSKPSKSREQSVHQGRPSARQEAPQRLGRDRTRTRTLSPREIKIAKSEHEKQQDQQKQQFSKNMASLAAAEGMARSVAGGKIENIDTPSGKEESDMEYEYEDDFEDYESDFEEDTESDISDERAMAKGSSDKESDMESDSDKELTELTPKHSLPVEEEKKLDSGNYDLAQRRRKSRELQEIKKALDRENESLLNKGSTHSHLLESSAMAIDEGFEEGRTGDTKKFTVPSGLHFINFANAKKRKQEQKKTARAKKRGELLLDMIRLDVMNFTLFELPPISYDVYMKSYGRSNTLQAQVQTNADHLSEEVQTDEIITKNKWTQKPVSFCSKSTNKKSSKGTSSVMEFSQDHLGVGGDTVEYDQDSWKQKLKINTVRLNQFLSSAGQVMSILLEETAVQSTNKLSRNLMEIPFSDGYISLGMEGISFLANRAVTILCFPNNHSTILLTVQQADHQNNTAVKTPLDRSIICIWNILEPSLPQKVLTAAYEITAACFDPFKASLVFAGLEEGSVCVWDLRERSSFHQKLETADGEWVLRSPTYNTAEIFKEEMHTGRIVALHPLIGSDTESELDIGNELPPIQICSLDEAGTINVWSVVYSSGLQHNDLGLAPWGRIRLVPSSSFSVRDSLPLDQYLRANLECFDLQLDGHDHSHLYIATNTGHVIHGLKSGSKPRPLLYVPNYDGYSSVRCIEPMHFGKPFFLIGCEEGTIRLHCQASHKPLATLAGTGDPIGQGPPIISIQWSRSCPSLFFALDLSSRIHIWDLLKSDIYPQYTVPFGTVTAMQLSPDIADPKNPPFMALATGPGRVEIHQLRSEYSTQSPQDIQRDLAKFLQYVSII